MRQDCLWLFVYNCAMDRQSRQTFCCVFKELLGSSVDRLVLTQYPQVNSMEGCYDIKKAIGDLIESNQLTKLSDQVIVTYY